MRSLAVKLTLAFLLVGLTGSLLVAVIIQQRTRTAFKDFIVTQEQQSLATNLEGYYQVYGTWAGVGNDLQMIFISPGPQPAGGPYFPPEANHFTLVGADRVIVYSTSPGQVGQSVSTSDLKRAVPLTSNGQTIGWLELAPVSRAFTPNTPEGNFLRNVNSATILSALVAVFLALSLGGILAFSMTRSLRELTEATVEIAKGKLGKQVKVRSKDEIGELASSFNQMSQDLARATQARRQMTADIAHDLRSPLSVITGYAEALSDSKLPGTQDIYNILLQETKHLDRLVDDLRLLSLADTGELPLTLQQTSPCALLERVAARHAVTARQCNLTLRIDAANDLPDVNVDVERMSQVLDNLIMNAFRFTPEGGEILLSAKTDDQKVQLIVQDNGKGISPDDLPHIFDRFYRGDKSRQNSGESGLGLAIAKSLVEAHGGTISAESTPNQGARFIVSLAPYNPT